MNYIKELPTSTVTKSNFDAQERLKRKKCIEKLFVEGRAMHLDPVRFVYLAKTNLDDHPQVLFVVPKKKIKSAVDRNIIKRRMRESYRRHRHLLTIHNLRRVQWAIACIYVGNNTEPYLTIENNFLEAFRRIRKSIMLDDKESGLHRVCPYSAHDPPCTS